MGGNVLAGSDSKEIVSAADQMMGRKRDWVNPYGDGTAGEQIVEICSPKNLR